LAIVHKVVAAMLTVFNQLVGYIDVLPSPWNTIVKWVLGIIFAVGFIFTNFKMVHYGTRSVKLRWGNVIRDKEGNPEEYSPGFPPKWVFPGVVKLISVSILDRQVEVQMQVQVAEYYLFNIAAVLNFSAVDVEKIQYVVEDLEPFLKGRGVNSLRESMTKLWHEGDSTISNAYVYHAQREFERIISPRVTKVGVVLDSIDMTVTEDPQMATARALREIARAIASLAPKGHEFPQLSLSTQLFGSQSGVEPIEYPPLGAQVATILSAVTPLVSSQAGWQELTPNSVEYNEDTAAFKKPRSQSLWHRALHRQVVDRL
jgi:hypothetical protein